MKIAIIGSGISGLALASILHPEHNVTVYEKDNRLGGHSRTVDVAVGGKNIPVDTGFIVFNNKNYPLLTSLFKHLNVPTANSNMSFGVSVDNGWLEYGTNNLFSLFAQGSNCFRSQFWRMLYDIVRFNRSALSALDENPNLTLGEFVHRLRMGSWFTEYYLLAMGGAIWSTSLQGMLDFPAATFIRFFENHGLLSINDQPQWQTVVGGSREYVKRLTAPFAESIRSNCGAARVRRLFEGVEVQDESGGSETYDHVVFACHSDQALQILESPRPEEASVLSRFTYHPNLAVLHSDVSFMQKRRAAWSSWVYRSEKRSDKSDAVSLSYWMNNLQPLNTSTPIVVTLNPGRAPDESKVYDRHVFEHPRFDRAAISAQKEIDLIQGCGGIWYCGAWQRYGFHEDGLLSAVHVAERIGIVPQWGGAK